MWRIRIIFFPLYAQNLIKNANWCDVVWCSSLTWKNFFGNVGLMFNVTWFKLKVSRWAFKALDVCIVIGFLKRNLLRSSEHQNYVTIYINEHVNLKHHFLCFHVNWNLNSLTIVMRIECQTRAKAGMISTRTVTRSNRIIYQ